MNYKIFLVGAVCGAATVAAVDWLLLGAHLPYSDDERIAEIAANSSIEAREAGRSLSFEDRLPDAPSASVQPETPSAVTEVDVTPMSRDQPESRQNKENLQTNESNDIARDTSYWLDKRREELEAEPKDDSWAYYMEQTLTQFLSRHPAIAEFEISYVECRTTICQIQVIGFDESTGPTWSRIMYDLRQVLPERTQEWGMSGYNLEGRHAIVQTIKRLDE